MKIRPALACLFAASLTAAVAAPPDSAAPPSDLASAPPAALDEQPDEARSYISLGLGQVQFEGDEEVKDSFISVLRLGYDYSDRWSFEGSLLWAPVLDANPIETSEGTLREGLQGEDTWSVGLAFDALFHFTRFERLDPFLAAGIGYTHYGDELAEGNQDDFVLRGGGGVMYHLNDEWALRADFRGMLAGFGENPNANAVIDAGLCWWWGARVPERLVPIGGKLDSDGDGLTDAQEASTRPTRSTRTPTRAASSTGTRCWRTAPIRSTGPTTSTWSACTSSSTPTSP